MDPKAAWRELTDALASGNHDTAKERAEALIDWIRNGGFNPINCSHCKFRSFRQAISVQTGRRFRLKPTGRFGPKRHPVVEGFRCRLWRTAAAE